MLLFRRYLDHPFEILEREFGIHRDKIVAEPDNRVHDLSALEPVLQGEVGGRQDLCQEVAEEQLAQAAAQFGRAQDLLQARDVLAYLEDLLRCFRQSAQPLAYLGNHLGRVIQPRVEISRGPLKLIGDLVQLGVHLLHDMNKLVVDGVLALDHGVGELAAERLDLLLEEREGRVDGFLLGLKHKPEEDQDR